jgi:hypothetical protein
MIQISELLPNPKGKDSGSEWIKITNDGPSVMLSGFSIKDASGKKYVLSGGAINPDGSLIIKDTDSKIILNNNGDTVFIYDAKGGLIDTCQYGVATDDEVIICHKVMALPNNAVATIQESGTAIKTIIQPVGRNMFGGIIVSLMIVTIFWIAYKEILKIGKSA